MAAADHAHPTSRHPPSCQQSPNLFGVKIFPSPRDKLQLVYTKSSIFPLQLRLVMLARSSQRNATRSCFKVGFPSLIKQRALSTHPFSPSRWGHLREGGHDACGCSSRLATTRHTHVHKTSTCRRWTVWKSQQELGSL